MNSSSLQLSTRLARLVSLSGEGEVFWDIGCDHGLVGREVLRRGGHQWVNFVDPSDLVIQTLTQSINSDIPKQASFTIYKQKGCDITVTATDNTFLMAGFGGQAIIETISAIHRQLSEKSRARFIISPHRDNLMVRAFLQRERFTLLHEEILLENGQHYEVMVVSQQSTGPLVSLYGEQQWRSPQGEARRQHLLKILPFHQNSTDKAYLEFLLKL